MAIENTVNPSEKDKFQQHRRHWWDTSGPLKTLHDINPARLAFVQECVDLSGKTILDVGCGGGVFTEALAKQAKSVTGIDIADTAIDVAKSHAVQSKLDIDYKCLPIESYPDASFDVITCMEMLEHVDNPETVLKHCARLLSESGVLILSTINRTPQAYAQAIIAAEYLLKLLPRQTHDYQKFIKPSELADMARSFDLEVMTIQGMNYNPFSRAASLTSKPNVNYLMALQK